MSGRKTATLAGSFVLPETARYLNPCFMTSPLRNTRTTFCAFGRAARHRKPTAKKAVSLIMVLGVLVRALLPGLMFIYDTPKAEAVGHNLILFWMGTTIPSGWTCISCSSGDDFYQRFIVGSSTYGVTGGSASSVHYASFVSSGAAGAVAARFDAAGRTVAADLHTHDSLTASSVAEATNLPRYGNIRLMRYDTMGDPATLPAGAVAMFEDSASVPTGWTTATSYDQQFLRGGSVTTTDFNSNSHSHAVTFTTGGPSETATIEIGSADSPKDIHTHDDNGAATTDTVTHTPPFAEIVLASLDSATTVIPIGILTMWDNTPDSHWTVTSGPGSTFDNRLISASSTTTFPTQGGGLSHSHANAALTSGVESDIATTLGFRGGGTQDPAAPLNHTHTITLSFTNESDHRPPFRTVIVAQKASEPVTAPTLTQRAAIFENDDGNTPATNSLTASGSPALTVEKGQRFVLRFQVENTGSATTSAYSVQYDRDDGTWNTVTSGEISIQFGISGSNGAALDTGPKANSGSCDGSLTYVNGTWHENATTTGQFTLGQNECTEFGFILSTATATVGATYNFRLVSATSLQPFNSVATPTITIVATQNQKHSKTGLGAELASAPTDSDDLTYYLDATGYAAVVSNDQVYDTATSTGSNIPISVFKIRNTNDNNTDEATITWNGQSNVAPATREVFLDIWNSDSNAWLTLTSNNAAGADTDFTLAPSATSGTALYDANFFVYLRVRQAAGAEALRTDLTSASFAPPPSDTATLAQRAFILENDNGDSVNTNTQRGTGIAYPIQQGERFSVRFQIDNTGDGATTANFHVQYDRNDGSWKSVSSGEVSIQLGISGSNGDALDTGPKANGGSCDSSLTYVNGSWHENTATTNSFTLNANECTEFGFIFSTATALPRTTYRFRLVNGTNGNQVLNSLATPTIALITLQEKNYSKTGLGAELGAAPAAADDLTYYLDATGYAAVVSDDGVYDTATSTGAGNVPVSLFKIRNPYANNTESFTVNWNGRSSVAPSTNNVFLDIWNNTLSAWVTVTTNNFSAANTDFTFSSVTSGTAFFDASFFVYVRARQAAGIEELRTDSIAISFGPPRGPQVDRSDVISDSRPGVSANHTVSFAVNSGFDASEILELDWPADFAFPTDLDCGDVDVATGTQFTLSTTSTACAAGASTWGAEFISDTRVFRLTAPSDPGTYIATGTVITFTIGLNASFQQSGTTQIVNPSSTGTYTLDVDGPVGTGRMLVAINVGLVVEVEVRESLSVSVSSVAAVNCTADDGASVTAVAATATTVPFGVVSADAFYIGCQDVEVATNAGGGYSATVQEQTPMRTGGGITIPDTTCDTGTCTESTAAAWTNAANNGFGHTCRNQVNNDCDSVYSNGTDFRQFAEISAGETGQEFMASSTPVSIAVGRVKYRLSVGAAQGAGTYTNTIVYIVTATF